MFEKIKAHLKGALKSWTIWFNGIAGVLVVAIPEARQMFPDLQGFIPDNLYHYGMGLLIVANILLRIKTKASLSDKGQ